MRARRFEIAAQAGLCKLRHLRGDLVRDHRYDSAPAQRHHRDGDGVVAREHVKSAGPRAACWPSARCCRSLLHPHDVFDFRQPRHGGRLDVHARAPLHAIDHDGQRWPRRSSCSAGRGPPAWAYCSRGHREDAIDAHALQLARQFDHLRCCSRPRRPEPGPCPWPLRA